MAKRWLPTTRSENHETRNTCKHPDHRPHAAVTGLAGCIGEGEAETEQQTIAIAGSSTVFPVASAWGQAYSAANADYPLPWPAVDLVQAPPRCAAPMPMQ